MKNPIVLAVAGAGTVLVVALGVWRAKRRGKRDVSEREAMLIEMRDRLEQMPIGRTMIEPELVPLDPNAMPYRPEPIEQFDSHSSSDGPRTGVLLEGLNDPIPSEAPRNEPRPSPFVGSPSNSGPTNNTNSVGPGGFTADPFDAVPHFSSEQDAQATPAPSAPEASPFDSFRAAPPEPSISAPAGVEAITTSPAPAPSIAEQLAEQIGRSRDKTDHASSSADDDDNFWNRRKTDPFEDNFDDMTASIADDESDDIRPNPTVPAADRTPTPAPRQNSLPTRRPGSTFTGPVKKAPAIAEVLASKATAPTPPVATTLQQGPPEVPAPTGDAAIDQAAYAAWLVDWLSYAECYGEETPEDPSRVSVG